MNQMAITCFLSVARTGSFAESARELYITRQAVYKYICEIEDDIGYPLFFRNSKPLTLTAAGEKMLSYYTSWDYSMNVARRVFNIDMPNKGGLLRIGWGRWFMPNKNLIDSIVEFKSENGMKLNVVSGTEQESLEYLRSGEADIAFLSKYVCMMIKEPYSIIPLSEEPIRLALSETFKLGPESDIDELIHTLPYLTCSAGEGDTQEIYNRVQRGLVYFKYPPKSIQILPNVETVQLQVMLGQGFTCMPNAQNFNHIQGIYLPSREGNTPTVTMCMVWLNRNENREVLKLRDWLLKRKVGLTNE